MKTRKLSSTATTSRGWGIVTDTGVIDLGVARRRACVKRSQTAVRLPRPKGAKPDFLIDQIEWLPPVPDPEKIICIGLNYRSHILRDRPRGAGEARRLHALREQPDGTRPADGPAQASRSSSTSRASSR